MISFLAGDVLQECIFAIKVESYKRWEKQMRVWHQHLLSSDNDVVEN
jgi:hypothetical protein